MSDSSIEVDASSKRGSIFTWKAVHINLLLREVLYLESYQHKQGSKERGAVWTTIAENLVQAGIKATQRSVREKFEKLLREFKKKEAMEERASGIEAEYTEQDQLLQDIVDKMSEYEAVVERKKEKERKDKETAEEMRKRATERLGETRRRHESEESVTPERKRRRNSSDVMQVLKESIEMKRKEQELAAQTKEKEMNVWHNQMEQQQAFIQAMMDQQQQFQQQQQAVTMSMLSTLAELAKNMKK